MSSAPRCAATCSAVWPLPLNAFTSSPPSASILTASRLLAPGIVRGPVGRPPPRPVAARCSAVERSLRRAAGWRRLARRMRMTSTSPVRAARINGVVPSPIDASPPRSWCLPNAGRLSAAFGIGARVEQHRHDVGRLEPPARLRRRTAHHRRQRVHVDDGVERSRAGQIGLIGVAPRSSSAAAMS